MIFSKKNIFITIFFMLVCSVFFYNLNIKLDKSQVLSISKIIPTNNSTITLILKGGLGNQLFQYATAYTIAKTNNYELLVDTNFYNGYIWNEICGYVLADILPNIKQPLYLYQKIKNYPKPICFLSNLFKKIHDNSKKIYLEQDILPSKSEYKKIKPNTYIEGYFFNYKYFSSYNDEIIKMFSNLPFSKNGLIVASRIQQEKANTIAIHFRDYSDVRAGGAKVKDYHGILSIDYYIAAIQIINEKCNNTKFYVFSNKIENAKKLFSTIKNLEFIEYSPDNIWEDMKLMSLCNHNIIANSSYSYWAAYLNKHKNKIVIAPKYFSPRQKNDNDFCPDNWIKVDVPFQ